MKRGEYQRQVSGLYGSSSLSSLIDTPALETIKVSERFTVLSLFTSIYGIGPTSARRLYNLGLRSLDDLEIYYGVERETIRNGREVLEQEQEVSKFTKGKRTTEDDELGDSWIRIALGLRDDLLKK